MLNQGVQKGLYTGKEATLTLWQLTWKKCPKLTVFPFPVVPTKKLAESVLTLMNLQNTPTPCPSNVSRKEGFKRIGGATL